MLNVVLKISLVFYVIQQISILTNPCFDIYILTQIIFKICSGGDDEDCRREDKVLGQPGIQQPDEEEPSLADGTLFHVNQDRVVVFMKTISKGNNSKTDLFALAKLY